MLGFVDEIITGVFFILSAGALSPASRSHNKFLFVIAGTVAMVTGAITAYDIHRVVYCDVMEGTWKCKPAATAPTVIAETPAVEEPPIREAAPQTTSNTPRTLRVDKYGAASEFRTIQSAIDAAKGGDTIVVASAVYEENLVVREPVKIKAEEECGVTVEGSGDTPVLRWGAKYGEIEDIRFLKSGTERPYGVSIRSGALRLRNVRASSKAGSAIFVYGVGTKLRMEQSRPDGFCKGEPLCSLEGSKQTGLFAYDGASVTVSGVSSCRNLYHGYSASDSGTKLILENARGLDNSSAGVKLSNGAHVFVRGGEYMDNAKHGIVLSSPDKEKNEKGVFLELQGAKLRGNERYGVTVFREGRAILTDVDLTGNAKGAIWKHDDAGEVIETRVTK